MPGYEPGVCNIGRSEIGKRYALAALGLGAAALLCIAVLAFGLPRPILLVSFIFLLLGFEGRYQGLFGFCAGFAARGIYDFTGSEGKRGRITRKEFHGKDMRKAMRIHAYSIASGVAVVAIIYLAAG